MLLLQRPTVAVYHRRSRGEPDILWEKDPYLEFNGEDQQLKKKPSEVILEKLKTEGRSPAMCRISQKNKTSDFKLKYLLQMVYLSPSNTEALQEIFSIRLR